MPEPQPATAALAAATQAATLTAQHLPDTPTRWADAAQATIRALIHRTAEARGLPQPELPYTRHQAAETALDTIGPLHNWTPLTIGEIHQHLLTLHLTTHNGTLTATRPKGATARDQQGSWYTPQPVAHATTRLALEAALTQIDPANPDDILRINAIDPACGAGVFLAEAAQLLAGEYARRLAGTQQPPLPLYRKVLPQVIYECVYGMDIDPVAIDLAHATLWLQVDGRMPFGWLDGNVACVDPLEGPDCLPARLLDVMGEPPPLDADEHQHPTEPQGEAA